MASGPKFTPHEREAKIYECSDLYLSGHSQNEIGARLGVTQQQISAYLKTLQKRWRAHSAEAIDARKARELARLDRLEREYWVAWARSCLDAESEAIENGTAGFNVKHTRKGQAGDPRFLEGIKACIEMRLKIVGGFAPEKHEVYDWRKDAERAGVNPDVLVNDLFAKVPQVTNGADEPAA